MALRKHDSHICNNKDSSQHWPAGPGGSWSPLNGTTLAIPTGHEASIEQEDPDFTFCEWMTTVESFLHPTERNSTGRIVRRQLQTLPAPATYASPICSRGLQYPPEQWYRRLLEEQQKKTSIFSLVSVTWVEGFLGDATTNLDLTSYSLEVWIIHTFSSGEIHNFLFLFLL